MASIETQNIVCALLSAASKMTSDELKELQDHISKLSTSDAIIYEQMFDMIKMNVAIGSLRAHNPGVPLDKYNRLMKCSCCGTTEGLHRDSGYNGPYRCSSPDCIVF